MHDKVMTIGIGKMLACIVSFVLAIMLATPFPLMALADSSEDEPRIIQGADSTWGYGAKDGIVLRSSAAFEDFVAVRVDGAILAADDYKARKGSTVVTLKPEYLSMLVTGEHIVGIESRNGTAETKFTIVDKMPDPEVPKLSDQVAFLLGESGLTDLAVDAWYMDPNAGGAFDDGLLYVYYTVGNGLMQGYVDQSTGSLAGFGPDDKLTRAQVATILYRYSNPSEENLDKTKNPELYKNISNTTPLVDVENRQWYTEAVNWCVENEIVTGIKDPDGVCRTFAPHAFVTREQLATMVGRLCLFNGLEGVGDDVSNFKDHAMISDWACAHVALCSAAKIISGYGDSGNFGPQDNATRSQMSKIIAVAARDVIK